MRTWIHRIATNVCLDMRKAPQRRALPMDLAGPSALGADAPNLSTRPAEAWVGPMRSDRLADDPADAAALRDSVMGRTLWSEWAEFWPANADDDFGHFINPVRKHVVSATIQGDLGWNSVGIEGDPVEYVRALASGDGGGITVAGGGALALPGRRDRHADAHRAPGDHRRGSTRVRRHRAAHPPPVVDSQITSTGNAVLTYSLRE